ncbi:MAG: LysR family transcriptional regulator [Myxococcales bacterium]|nr:LysR family transcriptional regulator [Myxococcales bacterium]
MNGVYGRDLDLNLLRVFAVVAKEGSVTAAAARLYLTQPAVSAALARLTRAVGAPLFVRKGRGLELSPRGKRLAEAATPHLTALVEAALHPPAFDPGSSRATARLGMSDAVEAWLVPKLLRALAREAPHMRLVVTEVQFRTVGEALASRRIDAAITVADELPRTVRRRPLTQGRFLCLFDPRHARIGSSARVVSERTYLAHEHVIVSYNADLRGVVEDALGKTRDVRCSVASFASIGAIVEGSALLATVPAVVAERVLLERPELRAVDLPFSPVTGTIDLLWPSALDDEPAARFVRDLAERVVKEASPDAPVRPGTEARLAPPKATPRARRHAR